MSQIKFRANLSAANIPYVSDFFSRSIIIPQIDQNATALGAGFSGAEVPQQVGIPQTFYAHNCMPTTQGMQSIGYTKVADPISPAQTDFDQCILLRDIDENKFYFSPANGKSYIYRGDTNLWKAHNTITPGVFSGHVTKSYLHGRTFVCYDKTNVYEYTPSTDTFAPAGITGVDPTVMQGICNAINYNILFDTNTLYWSNPLLGNETDFTPSPLTGAGSIQIQEAKGVLVACLPIAGGFIIYTSANAVKALYSGNAQFPWVFSEIPGSAGITSPEVVSSDANFLTHYAWTTMGLMKIDKGGAEIMFPEAMDFLAGRIFEDYDENTGLLTTQYLTAPLDIKLSVCGNRYVVVSYGIQLGQYTHALVFDLALKRAGKVKLNHVDCFNYNPVNFFGTRTYAQLAGSSYGSLTPTTYLGLSSQQVNFEIPGKTIAFLQADGTIQIVNLEVGNASSNGVLFIGKFQLLRKNILQLAEIEIENVLVSAANFAVKVLTSFNGKAFDLTTTPGLIAKDGLFSWYGCRVKGTNHTLLFTGAFNLVYLGLTVIQEGNR